MTKIKLCGLQRVQDVQVANALQVDAVGFVFVPQSKRCVSPEQASMLKTHLQKDIQAVGVFVQESPEQIAGLFAQGIIDVAQLHGKQTEHEIEKLRTLAPIPIWQAFCVRTQADVERAQHSTADMLVLDAGAGAGKPFDWAWLRAMHRPYFLAGGLSPSNVGQAVAQWHLFGVDVSSGIETQDAKDPIKMKQFVQAVRKEEEQ